jgi:hypothetical protein
MKRLHSIIFMLAFAALCAFGQNVTAPMPNAMFGSGMSWLRGEQYPLNNETTFEKQLGSSNWFASADVVTPFVKAPAGAPPIPSTITAGADYAVACSSSKSVCLLLTALGGVAAANGGAGAAPAFTGALKIWFRIGPVYIVPQAKVSNAAYSPTSGALATAVFSPALQVMYGFWPPVPAATPAPSTPTVKQMRVVMQRMKRLHPEIF